LPSPEEEKRLIATARAADHVAIKSEGKLQIGVLALRQAMHDYAARQLGLEARQLQSAADRLDAGGTMM
jgi:hypothetical protein